MGFRRGKRGTQPPAELVANPTDGAASPAPDDVGSTGVAIMPGVPLPAWIERSSLAESLVTRPPVSRPERASIDTEFAPEPVGAGRSRGTALPAPDPGQRREEPSGPVVWEPAPTLPEASVPEQSGPPAVEDAAVPAATAWYERGDESEPAEVPAAAVGQYGWLFEPDPDSAAEADEPVGLPEQAYPGSSRPVTLPPPPPGYYLPAVDREEGGSGSDSQPLPPPGYALADDTAPADPANHSDDPGAAAEEHQPSPVDAVFPWGDLATGGAPDGTPEGTTERVAPSGEERSDQQPSATGDRGRRGRARILVVVALLLLALAAALLLMWDNGLLRGSADASPAEVVLPPMAAGLAQQPVPVQPAGDILRKWAQNRGIGGQVGSYTDGSATATVLLSDSADIAIPAAFRQYARAGGPDVGRIGRYAPGPRGGGLQCAAARERRTVCFWRGDDFRGAADITGLRRTAAAELLGTLRLDLEPATQQ